MKMPKQISVFGGSSPDPGSETYMIAYNLGKLLGTAGMSVLTGGYMGTMEATSKGASETGGHVIGVTSEEIEQWRPASPNQYIDEEWRCNTFQERLNLLVENCDAAIALPGGIGTLLEICLLWNQVVVDVLAPKPMILVGSQWQKIMGTFFTELGNYIPVESREYIAFAPDPQAALELIVHFIGID